ncbi:uncharacterized protein LOC123523148 [Mercenaria mercenaria]|uniref:uncharacterized protein LOC123523148 n=1 Tax=Mercenaria mercenaria TaxID=6596 RepID=UPI00234E83B3|nr:uncharacterized protein LOC123523148 [Mercenaria mercenaria]
MGALDLRKPHILVVTTANDGTNIHVENFLSNHSSSQHTLNHVDSYTLYSAKYTNHAKVSSDKPITVVYVNSVTIVAGGTNADSMSISPVPVAFWGRQFIVPHMKPKSLSLIRIYAETINTIIKIQLRNRTVNRNLTFEGFHEVIFGPDALVVLSDKPVNVVQYGISMKYIHNDNDIGDAFMASVPAVNHFSNNYNFPCPFKHYNFVCRIAITIKSGDMYGLQLDGHNLSSIQSYIAAVPQRPFDNYRVLVLELSNGNHRLEHVSSDIKFSVFLYSLRELYGLGFYLGYSFTATEGICRNGGTCLDSGSCLCQIGYTGTNCEMTMSTLTCFSCQYASALAFCDSIEHCTENQVNLIALLRQNIGFIAVSVHVDLCKPH